MARSSIQELVGRESQLAAELRLHARGPVLSTKLRLSVMCGLATAVIWAATGLRYF